MVEREHAEEAAPEPTEEELAVEKEIELTSPEQKWLQDLELRAKEWKRDTSSEPFAAQAAIRKIRLENFDQQDIALFHAYRQLERHGGKYFKDKFGRLLRQRMRDTQGDANSTGYQLTKVLKAFVAAA